GAIALEPGHILHGVERQEREAHRASRADQRIALDVGDDRALEVRAQALRARRRAEIRRLSREIVGHEEERASRAAPDQAIKPLALGGLEHGLALGRQSRADLGGRGADLQLPGYREEARLAEEQHERLTDPALDPEETGRVDPKAP